VPANPREGRDPFFPESSRPYEDAAPTNKANNSINALAIHGVSYLHGRPMVIINNHTFAIGDEGDVQASGSRVRLRLIEIRKDAAVIEVNGLRRELTIPIK